MHTIGNLTPKTFVEELPIFSSLHQAVNILSGNIENVKEYDIVLRQSPKALGNYKYDPFLYQDQNPYKFFRQFEDTLVHIDEPEKEVHDKVVYVRMYTAVYNECLTNKYKDILQKSTGEIIIKGGDKVFWTAAGSLHRVLGYFEKYKSQGATRPLVRSFLVTEDKFKDLLSTLTTEKKSKQFKEFKLEYNLIVDTNYSFNQFGLTPSFCRGLWECIKPGSLITYGDQGSGHLTNFGQYRDIAELSKKLCGKPIHIWPKGQPLCLACQVTSFVDLDNEFIRCGNVGLLSEIGSLFYNSYLELRKFPLLTSEERVEMENVLTKDEVRAPTREQKANIQKKMKFINNQGIDSREELKAYNFQLARSHAPKDPKQPFKLSPKERMHYNHKYKTMLLETCPGIGGQIKELVYMRQEIKREIELGNEAMKNIILYKQKTFYADLIKLNSKIRDEHRGNSKKDSYLRRAFLELVTSILNDVLIYKGFPQNSLNILLRT